MSARLYWDTSALLIRLFGEPGNESLTSYLAGLGEIESFSSRLLGVEIQSAFRRRTHDQSFLIEMIRKLELEYVKLEGMFNFMTLTDAVINRARGLLEHSGVSGRLRSLDALHFATYLELASKYFQISCY